MIINSDTITKQEDRIRQNIVGSARYINNNIISYTSTEMSTIVNIINAGKYGIYFKLVLQIPISLFNSIVTAYVRKSRYYYELFSFKAKYSSTNSSAVKPNYFGVIYEEFLLPNSYWGPHKYGTVITTGPKFSALTYEANMNTSYYQGIIIEDIFSGTHFSSAPSNNNDYMRTMYLNTGTNVTNYGSLYFNQTLGTRSFLEFTYF